MTDRLSFQSARAPFPIWIRIAGSRARSASNLSSSSWMPTAISPIPKWPTAIRVVMVGSEWSADHKSPTSVGGRIRNPSRPARRRRGHRCPPLCARKRRDHRAGAATPVLRRPHLSRQGSGRPHLDLRRHRPEDGRLDDWDKARTVRNGTRPSLPARSTGSWRSPTAPSPRRGAAGRAPATGGGGSPMRSTCRRRPSAGCSRLPYCGLVVRLPRSTRGRCSSLKVGA